MLKSISDLDTPATWDEIKPSVMSIVTPLFGSLFSAGVVLAQRVKPREEAVAKELSWIDKARRKKRPVKTTRQGDILTSETLSMLFSEFPEFTVELERIDRIAEEFIENYTDDWWDQFSTSAQRRMRRIIITAQQQGLETKAVIDLARQYFNDGLARRIAVSEVTNVMGGAAQATYNAAGFPMWEWQTVQDSFVDPVCVGLHGTRYTMSVAFQKAHIGCRCWPVPVGDPLPLFGERPMPQRSRTGNFALVSGS